MVSILGREWKKCLVFSVTMTIAFRLTEPSDANKYNVFSNLQTQN
jgi:hypothetical protein